MSDSRIYICSDGHKLAFNFWAPENKDIKAFVQIVHGLSEYGKKYEQFAKYLNKKGYAVFASDLRGHGNTAEEDERGIFAEHNGWDRVVDDTFEIAHYVSTIYHAKNIFLVGSKVGSTVARSVMMQHPDFYTGVVLANPEKASGFDGKIALVKCKIQCKKNGYKSPSKEAEKRYYQNMPAKKDPLCDFVCSNSLYADILKGIALANSRERINKLPQDLPILIASENGNNDIDNVCTLYKSAGITDIQKKFFTEKKDFYDLVLSWLESYI